MEKLYLANSKDLVNLIIELQLNEYWPSLKFDRMVQQQVSRVSGGFGTATGKQIGGAIAVGGFKAQNQLVHEEIEQDHQLDQIVKVQNIIKNYIDVEAKEWVTPGTEGGASHANSMASEPVSPDGKSFRVIHSVAVDEQGNQFTLSAKDIILKPFVLSLDHVGDDHNLHQNHPEMNEDKRLSKP